VTDAAAHLTQRPQEDGERGEVGDGVEQVDEREAAGAADVHEEATQHSTDADAEVEHGEVQPEVPLPLAAGDENGDERVDGRPDDAGREAEEHAGAGGERLGRAVGHEHVGRDLEQERADDDDLRADAVDEGTDRGDDEQADEGRDREQQPDVGQLEATDLVQVHHVERHDEAGADEVHDDGRQQEPSLTGQVGPERGQRRPLDRAAHGPVARDCSLGMGPV
jgi:hypothetical protein